MHAADFSWDKPPSGRVKTAREMLVVEVEKIKKYGYANDI